MRHAKSRQGLEDIIFYTGDDEGASLPDSLQHLPVASVVLQVIRGSRF